MSRHTILLIDDSATERAVLAQRLEHAGYRVVTAENGLQGLRLLYEEHPQAVLLDVVMPQLDGWETLARIRQVSRVPVIMLTARDAELERVRGLKSGADDYVGKPASPVELTARLEAVLRRVSEEEEPRRSYDDGAVSIDYQAGEVRVRGELVMLTPIEFELLTVLCDHAGQVLSPAKLLELVWKDPWDSSSSRVRIYVGYLRQKIERDPSRPELIENVRGFGYRYLPPDRARPQA